MKIFIFFFFFKIQKFKFDQVDVFWLLQPAGLDAIVVRLIEREGKKRGINYPAGALSEISLYGYSLFMRLRKYANATWGVRRGAPLLASYLFSTSKRFWFFFFYEKKEFKVWE